MNRCMTALGVLLLGLALSGCKTLPPPVLAGTHTVCDVGPYDQRYGGPHLNIGDKIIVGPIGAHLMPTEVTFPQDDRVILATVHREALAGAYVSRHAREPEGASASGQHFVRIRRDPNYRPPARGGCRSRNVHVIEFCFVQDNAWRCSRDQGHYGHVHTDASG